MGFWPKKEAGRWCLDDFVVFLWTSFYGGSLVYGQRMKPVGEISYRFLFRASRVFLRVVLLFFSPRKLRV